MSNQIGRRQVIATALAVATASAAPDVKAKGVRIGFVTNEFRDLSNADLAREFKAEGIRTIQLFLTQTDSNYWKYNNRSDLKGLTPERCREIAAIYRSAGIEIHSIGVYPNLMHADPAERKLQLAYFEAMMKVGDAMGVRRMVTEAGHYIPPGALAQKIAYDFQEDVWGATVETGKEIARMADANNVTVLWEAFFPGFLTSAKRLRVFIEEIGSPRMRVNLDPANIIEVNDLDEMFNQLQPLIECLHAKDRKLHAPKGVFAGGGDLDYLKLLRLASERTPQAPLFLEYADSKSWKQALGHVRGAIQKAGLKEL